MDELIVIMQNRGIYGMYLYDFMMDLLSTYSDRDKDFISTLTVSGNEDEVIMLGYVGHDEKIYAEISSKGGYVLNSDDSRLEIDSKTAEALVMNYQIRTRVYDEGFYKQLKKDLKGTGFDIKKKGKQIVVSVDEETRGKAEVDNSMITIMREQFTIDDLMKVVDIFARCYESLRDSNAKETNKLYIKLGEHITSSIRICKINNLGF